MTACVHLEKRVSSSSTYLFVGRSTSSYEHHMETCESHDRDEEEPCYTHHHQTGHTRSSLTTTTEVDKSTTRFTVALLIPSFYQTT